MRIIDIDEESLKQIGQWPWPRTVFADLVNKLAANGAAAIGFDIVFPEPDRMSPANTLRFWPKSDALAGLREEIEKLPSNDQVFAEAIGTAPVVLGFIAAPQGTSIPETKAGFAHGGDDPNCSRLITLPPRRACKELQDKAQGSGSLNWIPEHDQIIRRMPMVVRVGDTLYPSFAAEMLRLAQGASTYIVKASGASGEKAFGEKTGIVAIKVGDFEVPTEANGQMWIRFTPESQATLPPGLESAEWRDRRRRDQRPHPDHRHQRRRPARLAGDAARCLRPRRVAPRPGHRADPARLVPATAGFRHRAPSSSTSSCSARSSPS